jgi:hypothetical protein
MPGLVVADGLNTLNSAIAGEDLDSKDFQVIGGKIQVKAKDFFRTEATGLLPDGLTDTAEQIIRYGNLKLYGDTPKLFISSSLDNAKCGELVWTTYNQEGFGMTARYNSGTLLNNPFGPGGTTYGFDCWQLIGLEYGVERPYFAISHCNNVNASAPITNAPVDFGTISFGAYPETRADGWKPKNFLHTDPLGIVRSSPIKDAIGPLPSFASDTVADAALASGQLYKITGSRAVYQRP